MTFDQRVRIDNHTALKRTAEVIDWLTENVGVQNLDWEVAGHAYEYRGPVEQQEYFPPWWDFGFTNVNDAANFKLRWCESC